MCTGGETPSLFEMEPIPDHFSPQLRRLVYDLLQIKADKRPDIDQVLIICEEQQARSRRNTQLLLTDGNHGNLINRNEEESKNAE